MRDPDVERFWTKVTVTEGCWAFTGTPSSRYGRFWYRGRNEQATHVAWILTHGAIPEGMVVCHHCDNPRCVRPEHLFLGTPLDNSKDMVAKGRSARGDLSAARKHPESLRRGHDHWSHLMPERVLGGSRHGYTRLSDTDVLEIRRLRRDTPMLLREIATQYGVHLSTIQLMVTGKTWKHIGEELAHGSE